MGSENLTAYIVLMLGVFFSALLIAGFLVFMSKREKRG